MTSLSQRMSAMTGRELLTVFGMTARLAAGALESAGPVAPSKGPRALRRRAKRRRYASNVARREQVASRKATVAINRHGIYIERRRDLDRATDLLRRLG